MSSASEENSWPMPKFYFLVDYGDVFSGIAFQEVSGLETETQPIEFRQGNASKFESIKMPGISKYGNVTLKRGTFVKDNVFWNWYNQVKLNTIRRQTMTVKLLDESGRPTITWTLKNAWPTKITATNLESDGNEVVVETMELAHEGLTIAHG